MTAEKLPAADELIGQVEKDQTDVLSYTSPRLAPTFLPLRVVLIAALLALLLAVPQLARSPVILWITLGLALISVAGTYLMERRGLLEHRLYRWALPAIDVVLVTLLHLGSCGAASPFFPLFYVPIACAGLLGGYPGGLLAGLAASSAYGMLYAVGPLQPEDTVAVSVALLFPAAGLVCGYIGHSLARLEARGQMILEQAQRLRQDAETRQALSERWYRSVDRLKADLVCSASCELRTPLTPIKGYLQYLLSPGLAISEVKMREYMQLMSDNVDMLTQMVDDIIYLQRVIAIPIDLQTVAMSEVARQAIEEAASESEEARVQVELYDGIGLPPVQGNTDSLKLALASLLENAIHNSPAGGVVALSLRPDEGGVRVQVAGAGRGMPAETQERLLDLFSHAGSFPSYILGRDGLSLAIARYIVEMHGGRLSAESQPREGVVFTILLPGGK